MTMSKERSLQLKFLGEVCGPALTGKVLKGKEGNFMRVALVDKTTGEFVKCGPESSAQVEILLLDASGDKQNWTLEDFNNRIIKEGNKKKPHFAKSVCINLKEGIGNLGNAKLGHGANWVKSCNCRLGARIVQTVTGIEVQEAWTESFMVSDSRGELYKKHYPPSLSSEVWRLDNITRDGAPCKHLNEEKVETVRDFLFLHSVNPGRLEQIVRNGTKTWKPAMWKVTVDHAKTCKIGEERMYYPSTESKMGVMFDAVGGLKGVIQESHYVPIENLSADEKDSALKLLLSVFENQKKIIPFKDEASFLQRFPCRSSDINVSTHSSTEAGSNGSDPNISENVGELHPTELGTSFQSISSYTRTSDHSNLINHCGSLGSTDMGHLYGANLSVPVQFASQFSAPENIDGRAPIDPDASSQGISPYTRTSDHLDHISHFGSLGSAGQLYECTSMDMPPQLPSWQFLGLENITGCASTFPGTSSQGISQYNRTSDHPNHINNFGSLESIGTGQLYESTSMDMGAQLPSLQFHDLENINGYPPIGAGVLSQTIIPSVRALNLPNDSFHFGSPAMGQLSEPHLGIQIPTCQSSYPDSILEQFSDDGTQTCVIISEINKPSKTQAESLSHQQSNSQASCLFGLVVNVVNAKIWLVRAKKKVMQGIHVQKKQRVQPVA